MLAMHSIPHRPPPLRCIVFHSIYLPHLHNIPSDSYWASVCMATLPDMSCLICDFCSSDQSFAIRLPSDSISRWTPLSLAIHFPLSGCVKDFHLSIRLCPCRANHKRLYSMAVESHKAFTNFQSRNGQIRVDRFKSVRRRAVTPSKHCFATKYDLLFL